MAIKGKHVKAVIQFRRATEAEWYQYNPILRQGEPALSTDIMKVKVGDGTTDWVSLQYIDRNVADSVIFVDTLEGLTGELYKLYIALLQSVLQQVIAAPQKCQAAVILIQL